MGTRAAASGGLPGLAGGLLAAIVDFLRDKMTSCCFERIIFRNYVMDRVHFLLSIAH